MKKYKKILFLIILLVYIGFIYAETISWNEIPSKDIPLIPANEIEYSKLTNEQKQSLTVEQIIVNLEVIDNLYTDVNVTRAEKALNKVYNSSFEIKGNCSIRSNILKTDVEQLEIHDYYKGSLVMVNEYGKISFIPSNETDEIIIGKNDSFFVDTSDINKEGFREVKLNITGNIIPVSGKFFVNNGEIYVSEGVVNGLSFERGGTPTKLFFDGEKHPESKFGYVSISPDNKNLIISSGYITQEDKEAFYSKYSSVDENGDIILAPFESFDLEGLRINMGVEPQISFKESNSFFKIENGDYLSITTKENSGVEIINRDDEGLIPKINPITSSYLSDSSKPIADIENGPFKLSLYKESLKEYLKEGGKGSPTPLIISYGNEQKKVKVTNYGEIYGLTGDVDRIIPNPVFGYRKFYEDHSEDIASQYDYEKYNVQNLREKFPHISFTGPIIKDSDAKKIDDSLTLLPPKVLDSIKAINLISPTSTIVGKTGGDRHILINPAHTDFQIIYHEAAHALHAKIREEEDVDKSIKDYNKYATSSFDKKWIEAANFDYEFNEENVRVNELNENGFWKDDKSNKPKNGLIRPYSSFNIMEDVATYMEVVYNKPEFFEPLINPSSSQYDSRYVKKLELLNEYGFISQENFDEIMFYAN